MTECVVLHAAPALIERGVGELHDMERISDLDGVGQHRVEHRPIRRRTDRALPTRHQRATRRCARRASDTVRCCHGRPRHRGAGRVRTSTIWVDQHCTPESALAGRTRSHRARAQSRRRSGWGRRSAGCRRATTASITVCQSHPRSSATSCTERPCPPTCRVTQRAARVVSAHRADAICGSCSVHVRRHTGHCQRCLHHTNRAGRPNTGRSTNTTSRVSCRHADRPQHDGRSGLVVIAIRNHPGHSPTPTTVTPDRPTSSAHMRVGSVSKQGLLETQ